MIAVNQSLRGDPADAPPDWKVQLDEARKVVEEFVRSQPVWALGLSLGIGVIVGWIVKRH